MNLKEIKNLQPVKLKDIPCLQIEEFREQILACISSGMRPVKFFGDNAGKDIMLYAVLADDKLSKLHVASTKFDAKKSYQSMTQAAPSLHLFERELFEQFGIEPLNHPWLKPVRKGIAGTRSNGRPYNFFEITGEEIHEVGVGPIHAGIIEPGHFRFSCHGEDVYNLEIELGFQHRGVEDLFIRNNQNKTYLLKLAESVAGDSVIGHAGTFARAIESLSGISVPRKAMTVRTVALELERIALHLGDLSALSNDVAYSTGSSVFGALRTKVINTTMLICGSRFGRGLITIGGVNFDISNDISIKLLKMIDDLENTVELASGVLFSSSSVLARFEKTGIVNKDTSAEINMVGPAARASGVALDVRTDHPYGGFVLFPVHKLTLNSGDVFARAYIRYVEITQSIRIIKEQLSTAGNGIINTPLKEIAPDTLIVSLAEGWRGEIAHAVITDDLGKIKRYKIKDPSFNNWLALALAVRDNGISDFPLCNKSFNLSYCGFDL